MAKMRFGDRNVGAPHDTFSSAHGSARHSFRSFTSTRGSGDFEPADFFGAGLFFFLVTAAVFLGIFKISLPSR
jgi:hypothetical protein